MHIRPGISGLAFLLAIRLAAAGLQPFQMPWDDASAGITNLQGWQTEPAGQLGWVRVTPSGHYAVGGEPIRFLGVDVAASFAMPSHPHADAHAARLARFGFNAVRLHHLEAPWEKDSVLIDYASGSSRNLSPDRLDKLQYFIAQLAAHGIYSDVNLLVSREFQATDGLGPEVALMGWKDQQILGFFNDTALALHQEHATKLLTAPNPYRNGVSLAKDPAVAFVEIMNENGLLENWFGGVLDSMPAVYRDQLQAKWNQWLAKRYPNTAGLLAGWGAVDQPLGANLVTNGNFASGMAGWNGEQHDTAVATFTGTSDFNGGPALKIVVTRAGTASWHVQVNQSPLNLAANGYYTITFWAKADAAVPFYAGLSRSYGDYGGIGSGIDTTLGTAWQQYTVALQNGAAEANARINFGGFGDRTCTVWLADVRVQPGGKLGGLPAGTSLEAGNIPSLLMNPVGGAYSAGQRADWVHCLLGLESAYWNAMYRHVKVTLGYPGIVWGTIISNSPPNAQACFDAMDSHAYWQHPTWPAGQEWDPVTWTIPNTAMVNDTSGGTIGGIALQRVRGKPHNVTEYQHPSPNSYAAEGPLLAAAYAALQDWDGLWFFDYSTADAEYVTEFFDHGTHPGRMANNILAAALFRRADVTVATHEYTLAFPPEKELSVAATLGVAWSIADASRIGVPPTLALTSRVNLSIGANATGLTDPPAAPAGPVISSDTGELRWDNSLAGNGVVTIDSARTKAVVGFAGGRTWSLGGVQIAPGTTNLDWSTIGLTLVEGSAFDSPAGGRALVVATGGVENTGQKWKDATHTSIGADWGSAPTLVEVVPATITLPVAPARVTAWALDARGQRTSSLAIANAGGHAQLTLGANGTTVWYEAVIAPAPAFDSATLGATALTATAQPGAPVTFTCTVTNTGTNAWGPAHLLVLRDASLAVHDPANPKADVVTAPLNGLPAGSGKSIALSFTAPTVPGQYAYYLQGKENPAGWFGSRALLTLTVVVPAADFNGDGRPDILWQNTVTGERIVWLMDGPAFASGVSLGVVPNGWAIAGIADFDGDGRADVLWNNAATGEWLLWLMTANGFGSSVALGSVAPEWSVAGIADFNGDGQPDLLWENSRDGECVLWLMNGPRFGSSVSLGVIPLNWTISGTGDFNHDGHPDIVWTNSSNGERLLWLMDGTAYQSSLTLGIVPASLQISGVGDFNGDGWADLVMTNTATNERSIWLMDGPVHAGTVSLGIVDPGWALRSPAPRAIALAKLDFNRDGQTDLAWENTATGEHYLWLMNRLDMTASVFVAALPVEWRLAASGDFDGDGQPDLVWENTATGERSVWLMNGAAFAAGVPLGVVSPQWRIADTGDFNGDGEPDLVWENTATGERYVWLMNGTTFASSIFLGVVSPEWRVAATGDFNGDGQPDLVWENAVTGEHYVWLMDGATFASSAFLGVLPVEWRVATTGDFNGDGQADLVWENTTTGERYIWLMNGTTFASSVLIGVVPTQWRIAR